jgi:hypothetical protein
MEFQMDNTEKPKKPTRFANQAEVTDTDAAALPSSTGRETNTEEADPEISSESRRSEVTGRHDSGSGANETADGLTSSEEALRRGAEDIPLGAPERDIEDLPVFDRADALPKI